MIAEKEAPTRDMTETTLIERVALTRLHRFERLAAAAEGSDSPLWRHLAQRAAELAWRDCVLAASLRIDDAPRVAHAA